MPVRVAKEAVVQNVDEDILEFEDTGSPVGTPTKERIRAISETEKSVLGKPTTDTIPEFTTFEVSNTLP